MAFDLSDIDGVNGFRIDGFLPNGQFGATVSELGDVNGDGIDDIIIGAPFVYDQQTSVTYLTGRSFVIFGSEINFGESFDLQTLNGLNGFAITQSSNARSGWSVASAGDYNDDGLKDIIIGSPDANSPTSGAAQAGQAQIVYGRIDPFPSEVLLSSLNESTGFTFAGRKAADRAGHSVSSAGDFNGDGIDDVIIGAPFDEILNDRGYPINTAGAAYVLYGDTDPGTSYDIGSLNGSAGLAIYGTTRGGTVGRTVAPLGDINGDGYADIFIGTRIGLNDGVGHVIFGARSGLPEELLVTDLDGSNGFSINAVKSGDDFGVSASGIGDVNGDGIDDFVVGAPNKENSSDTSQGAGRAYVIFGSGTAYDEDFYLGGLNGTNGFRIIGEDVLDRTGVSVSSAGDVNGDGIGDLIIGASDADRGYSAAGQNVGATYVVFGSRDGYLPTLNLDDITYDTGLKINGGSGYSSRLGASVSSAGDLNKDGFDDLLIGAPQTGGEFAKQGAAYVIYGSAALGYLGSGQEPPDDLPNQGGAPDFGGDGYDDIMFFSAETREVGMFEMPAVAWRGIGMAGTGWEVRGSGRFDNNDESPDILWYNPTTRNTGRFDIENGVLDGWRGMGAAGAGWEYKATGDFNGDTVDDVLWFNEAHSNIGQFRMSATGVSSWRGIAAVGDGWEVVGTGDINGDGTDDILWFNDSTNTLGQFRMSSTGAQWIKVAVPSTGYEVAATGDFGGDGTDDILVYKESTRELGYFDMAGGTQSWVYLDTYEQGWSVQGTGDFNNDGRDDILWRHTDGRMAIYEMDGTTYEWADMPVAGSAWEAIL